MLLLELGFHAMKEAHRRAPSHNLILKSDTNLVGSIQSEVTRRNRQNITKNIPLRHALPPYQNIPPLAPLQTHPITIEPFCSSRVCKISISVQSEFRRI